MLIKCICTNCAGHLEFEEENAGEQIACPHCGFRTTLFVPGTEEHETLAAAARKRQKWRRLRWLGGAVLVLVGLGWSLQRWVVPLVRELLPDSESVVLPYLVLGLGLLLIPVVLVWALFPVVLCLQLRTLIEVALQIEANLRPISAAESDDANEQAEGSGPEASEPTEN